LHKYLILYLFACWFSAAAQDTHQFGDSGLPQAAQWSITGKVTQLENGAPLEGAHFYVDGLTTGTTSDSTGRYFILLNPGSHRLTIRHVTRVPKTVTIDLYGHGVLHIALEEKALALDEVVVESSDFKTVLKEPFSGVVSLSQQQLKSIPALLGEADIARSLQFLPGVTSSGEGASGSNIRGGRTDQNLMLINDAIVLSANHAAGFLSPFNAEVAESFLLYKGVMPSYYGGRSASTLAIRMRKGDFEKWKTQLSGGTAIQKVLVEGPLLKNKISVLSTGRISSINWMLDRARNPDVNASRVKFSDSYSTISAKLNSKHFLDVALLTTQDYSQIGGRFGYEWSSYVGSLSWKGVLSDKFAVSALIATGNFENGFFELNSPQAASLNNGLGYDQARLTAFWSTKGHEITIGSEAVRYRMRPEVLTPAGTSSVVVPDQIQRGRGIESSFFASDEWTLSSAVSISIGLRYSIFQGLGPDRVFGYADNQSRSVNTIVDTAYYSANERTVLYDGWEPRASMSVKLSAQQSVKIGYSRMFQYIHSLSNTASPTPIDLWQLSSPHILPQASHNFSFGHYGNFASNKWSTVVEVFYRTSGNQLEYKDFADLNLNPHLETEIAQGQGQSYGLEVQVKRNMGKWTGWLSYTFSRALVRLNSQDPEFNVNRGDWFAANHDRPHVAALVINRKLWPKGLLGITANYATGRPVTAVDTYYFQDGVAIPNFSDRNQYRIPNYFRIDFSVTTGSVFKKIDDSLSFSVYNLLHRDNAFSVFFQPAPNQPRPLPYQLSLIGVAVPAVSYTVRF
jgi:hypothetical protein